MSLFSVATICFLKKSTKNVLQTYTGFARTVFEAQNMNTNNFITC